MRPGSVHTDDISLVVVLSLSVSSLPLSPPSLGIFAAFLKEKTAPA